MTMELRDKQYPDVKPSNGMERVKLHFPIQIAYYCWVGRERYFKYHLYYFSTLSKGYIVMS